jgi:Cys-tRNA(Pro)/Cys-tRNA(Cys) deacylase
MLPLKDLEPLTGYQRGGCSPVGSRKKLPVYFDETAQLWEELSVSAGHRGLQMLLEPDELLRAAEGRYADLI